ncbi:MAG: hypothetical protein ACRDZ8_17055 [Acidimicrobiales bacterium]
MSTFKRATPEAAVDALRPVRRATPAVPEAAGNLLHLQRAAGNRAVVGLLARHGPTAVGNTGGFLQDAAPAGNAAALVSRCCASPENTLRRVPVRGFAATAGARSGGSLPAGGAVISERIQRHASWEHKMLGDVDPDELEVISSARDLVAERKNATQQNRAQKTLTTEDGKVLDPDTVLHAIEQEITRLQTFATNPPKVATRKQEEELAQLDRAKLPPEGGQDVAGPAKKWDVRLVAVRLSDDTDAILTYGEVNTLADFFGSTEQIRQTDPKQFRSYVAGIREESIRKFMRFHTEVAAGLGRQAKYNADADEHAVNLDGNRSMGNTGTSGSMVVGTMAGGDAYGELKMMGKVPGATASELQEKRAELPGKAETSYTAGLGRNACHFAPQSWHSWAEAHNKGVQLAQQAYVLRNDVNLDKAHFQGRTEIPDRQRVLEWAEAGKRAEKLENEALFENGFGDHFLQDSFAAGHLINKTLIMQWFTKWLDENSTKRSYTSDPKWRRVQNIAYGQSGIAGRGLYNAPIGQTQSNDAQSVENMGGTWQQRFDALGLEVPGSLKFERSDTRVLFAWWQSEASEKPYLAKHNVGALLESGPIKNRPKLERALKALINDGVVYYDNYSSGDRLKGSEAIGLSGFFGDKTLCLKAEYIPKRRTNVSAMSDGGFGEKAKAVTYGDYHTFLNHGYLQLSTNALHDYFCKNGLWVDTEEGRPGYKIYGDNNMLQTESARMVKWSGQTSRMSRDSIVQLATTGRTANTTAAIAGRIPKYVSTVKDGTTIPLDRWHGESKTAGLKKLCFDTVFPDCSGLFSKSTAIASDVLADKISKDTEAGEAF